MKAVLLRKPRPIEQNPLDLENAPIPNVASGQILLKVTACGVCRSNLHMIEGDWVSYGIPAKSPIIPGHEIVGRVARVANDVASFREGDKVGVQALWSSCGRCEFCLSGRENICQSRHMTGEDVDGGYAEYTVANADYAYHVPDNLKDSEAAPLFCPGISAYGAVKKAQLSPGKKVAVFGIGGVGHMAIQFARLYGADVVAVSRNIQHLKLAEELGAGQVVNTSKGTITEWLKAIGTVDSSIVFAPSGTVVQLAIKATKPGGITVTGVWTEIAEPLAEERKVANSLIGSRNDMKEVLALASAGKIGPVYEEFKLERASEVLNMLKKGDILARAVLVP
jgi:propanol-preferring alcohol dehydrogenase